MDGLHPLFKCTHHITVDPPTLLSDLPQHAHQISPSLISLTLPVDSNPRTQPPHPLLETEYTRLQTGIMKTCKLDLPNTVMNTTLQRIIAILRSMHPELQFSTPYTHRPFTALKRPSLEPIITELRSRTTSLRVTKITEIRGKSLGYLHLEQHRPWPPSIKRHLTNTVHAEITAARPCNQAVEIALRKKIDSEYVNAQNRRARQLDAGDNAKQEDVDETYETELRCRIGKLIAVFMMYDEEQHGKQKFAHQLVENASASIPALQATILAVKQWLSSHLLLESFYSEELVELICVSVLQKVECTDTWTGFNNVLRFFSTFAFTTEPVMVKDAEVEQLNKHVKSNQMPLDPKAVKAAFDKRRKLDPTLCHCVMYLATSRDVESRDWTWQQPSKPILKRTKDLATATLDFLSKNYATLTKEQYSQIFTPSWTHFDAVIHINAHSRHFLHRYVMELHSVYGHTTLFFYNKDVGQKIGVMFHPSLLEPRIFKKNIQYPVKTLEVTHICRQTTKGGLISPFHQNNFVCADLNKILTHFEQLGSGIVEKVVPRNKKLLK